MDHGGANRFLANLVAGNDGKPACGLFSGANGYLVRIEYRIMPGAGLDESGGYGGVSRAVVCRYPFEKICREIMIDMGECCVLHGGW